jgi:hypothetical protein
MVNKARFMPTFNTDRLTPDSRQKQTQPDASILPTIALFAHFAVTAAAHRTLNLIVSA